MCAIKCFVVAAGMLFALAGCASLGQKLPPPPTIAEIVEMSKSAVPPETIIQKMKDSAAVYNLSASEYGKLHEQGVSDEVLNAMQASQLEAVRRDALYHGYSYDPWYWGPPYSWGPYPHRYPWWW